MGIKNLKPTRNARTRQGYFNINESKKYIGREKKVIYRSSWEYQFCVFCEQNSNILNWSSESIEIKYLCPIENRIKNYYPDFLVKFASGKIWLVEIKPEKEYKTPPPKPKRKTKKTLESYEYLQKHYLVNNSKFKSAIAFCKERGWNFQVLDENWFKIKTK